ncbi:MAG TPA: helix-turn-helix transcriptional regulator [Ktedonobacterales bacterium]|jgi:DNA-binding PadR family transcriptional regulator
METDTSANEYEYDQELRSLLPLTPAVFHILLALANGERHGYGILLEIAAITHAQRRIGPGTLYRSIKQMLAAGMIEEADERPDPSLDDERRRYYRLTAFGRRVALAEAQRLAQLVRAAEVRRLLPGSAGTPGIEGNR